MSTNSTEYMRTYREQNRAKIREQNRRHGEKYKASGKRRAADLQRQYGISSEQFDAMLDAQGHRCAICRAHVSEKKMCVDHDHETGRVRGLLCRSCNSALGKLGDSVESLRRALEYLEESPRAAALSPDEWPAVGLGLGLVSPGAAEQGEEVN